MKAVKQHKFFRIPLVNLLILQRKFIHQHMNAYKFRVVIDSDDDVFRDIEILNNSSFKELHTAILGAFDFKEGEMASFYMSNDHWDKGDEIPLMDMGLPAELDEICMTNCRLCDYVLKPDEKIIYVYDFLRMWCFYIELIEQVEANPAVEYPLVSMVFGEAPSHESKEIGLFDDFDSDDHGGDDDDWKTGDPEIDAYLDDEDESDEFGGFESLDDLDEYI